MINVCRGVESEIVITVSKVGTVKANIIKTRPIPQQRQVLVSCDGKGGIRLYVVCVLFVKLLITCTWTIDSLGMHQSCKDKIFVTVSRGRSRAYVLVLVKVSSVQYVSLPPARARFQKTAISIVNTLGAGYGAGSRVRTHATGLVPPTSLHTWWWWWW